jgi:hypothetical protein
MSFRSISMYSVIPTYHISQYIIQLSPHTLHQNRATWSVCKLKLEGEGDVRKESPFSTMISEDDRMVVGFSYLFDGGNQLPLVLKVTSGGEVCKAKRRVQV